jgi:hypothetical protein
MAPWWRTGSSLTSNRYAASLYPLLAVESTPAEAA